MKVHRVHSPRPPAAVHILHRRIYGTSGHLRSVTRRRLRQIASLSASTTQQPRAGKGDE